MIKVIIGMQWGSEGKGSVAQIMATRDKPELAIRVGGPNAGHSIAVPGGTFALRHVPAAVVSPKTKLALGPESLVLPEVLADELDYLHSRGWMAGRPLYVDPRAAVITKEDIEEDAKDVEARGSESTRKGIGVTRAKKARRVAKLVGDRDDEVLRQLEDMGRIVIQPSGVLEVFDDGSGDIHIESTQGFLLSTNYGDYPHVTSRDLTVTQALNDAGIGFVPGVGDIEVIGVARTFPIRIAGNSGPLPGEINWDDLARITDGYVKPEYTTVTKKVRRVAEWNDELFLKAVRVLRPDIVFFTFMDYLVPDAGRAAQTLKAAHDDAFDGSVHDWNTRLVKAGEFLTAAFAPVLGGHARRLASVAINNDFTPVIGVTLGQAIGAGPRQPGRW